jgi:HK97 family phage major capsid protein/HK97 family phage prohead protease
MTIAKSYIPGYAAGTTLKNCANCAAFQEGICAMYNVPVAARGYCEDWHSAPMPAPVPMADDATDAYERGEMKVHGGALQVKAVTADTVTVEGYGVLFGGTDLDGDTFSKSTAFALERMKRVPVFFDHAMDEDLDDTPLGYIKEMHEDDTGLWVEAQLNRNQRYTQAVMKLIENKALGWSSGSVSHLVRREGGAIRSWPIVEFSLTPTPAESRLSGAVSAKGTDPALPVDINPTLETTKDIDMDEETLAALLEQAASKAADRIAVQSMKTPAERQAEDQPVKADPAVDELKAQNKALTDQVQQIMKLLDTEPAQRTGYVTPDGGTADKDVKNFGDFVKAIGRRDHKRLAEVYGARKALEENSGVTGGYLVPTQFVNQLTEYAAEMSIVKPRAFRVDMSAREAEIPAIDYANTVYSKGNTVFTAGLVMEWTAERKKIPNTQPKFRQMQLEAHKMSGLVPVSNELLSDSGQALEQLLVRLFGSAIAFAEDYAFLAGDGNGKPLGVLNAPATITTGTALTAAAPEVSELSSMYSRLMIQSRRTAVWVVHQLLTDALMSINSSGTNVLTYLPDLRGEIIPRLFGMAVIETEKLPTTFANGGLILADFQQYVVGNRQEIEIAMSEHAGFNEDETQWRCIARCDGQPYINGPVKIGSGANDTVSAFVKSK